MTNRDKLLEIFGTVGITVDRDHYHKDCVKICIDLHCHDEITFAELARVSEILKTNKINIGDYEATPGCDTCGHGSTKNVTIYCREVDVGLED